MTSDAGVVDVGCCDSEVLAGLQLAAAAVGFRKTTIPCLAFNLAERAMHFRLTSEYLCSGHENVPLQQLKFGYSMPSITPAALIISKDLGVG